MKTYIVFVMCVTSYGNNFTTKFFVKFKDFKMWMRVTNFGNSGGVDFNAFALFNQMFE